MRPAEAALLAGIPEDPSLWDPVAHPNLARARRNLVLRRMFEQGYLGAGQFHTGVRTPLPEPQKIRLPATQSSAAPYFANYVTDQLVRHYGTRRVYGGNLHVRTTIDLGLQKLAREAIVVSDNSVFAQLTNIVGPPMVARTAKALGITTPLRPYFAIGLGAEPATPLEMARAYASFADGGYRLDDSFGDEPRIVDCVAV